MLHPTTYSYTWIADVKEGTSLLFFMVDSQGRQGGVSPLLTVLNSTDASCFVPSEPSSTVSAPSQTPSQSTSPGSNTSTVGIIGGAAIGAVVLLVLLIILGICYKRMTFKHQSRRLQREDHLSNWTLSGMLPAISESRCCMTMAVFLPAFSKSHSDDIREYGRDGPFMISARTCFMLHGTLVIIHFVLVISYISHWEHRTTFSFTSTNIGFWSGVLSASLQAFYTVCIRRYIVFVIYKSRTPRSILPCYSSSPNGSQFQAHLYAVSS